MNSERSSYDSPAPSCPKCGTLMVKRTANKGNQFWGCGMYPDCRGTRPIDHGPDSEQTPKEVEPSPVDWQEGVTRFGYIPEYISIGAMPGILQEKLGRNEALKQALTQCLMLYKRGRNRLDATQHARLISKLLQKLLQRGRSPLPTLNIEHEALRSHGLLDYVNDLSAKNISMGWELKQEANNNLVNVDHILASITYRCPFSLDSDFSFISNSESLLQSPEEEWFINKWVPKFLGITAAHWFTPQASLDRLLEANHIETSAARRVDFLFSYPLSSPIVVEIDGIEHEGSPVDKERDRLLNNIGIEVFRITHNEIHQQKGDALVQLKSRIKTALADSNQPKDHDRMARFLIDCSNAAKLQFAIAYAIEWGWLVGGQNWTIELASSSPVMTAGVLDTLEQMSALDVLYGGRSTPDCCTVRGQDGFKISWRQGSNEKWLESEPPSDKGCKILVAVESDTSPYHAIDYDESFDIILRPTFLPVKFATRQFSDFDRTPIVQTAYEEAESVLTYFLQTIFRKYGFRLMQGNAVFNTLRQNDCVVLLPTGAGKSIIYQLAGLLMPGITIVIAPLVALIDDQTENLHNYGIDRTLPIFRGSHTRDELVRTLRSSECGEHLFILISPERLQTPNFRRALIALTQNVLVNLAVVDEAHCVSEWGHEFRPAYLNLGNNLRRFCKKNREDFSEKAPPLLALTGTASRAVLRDLLADLNIDRNRSDALIRPDSFNRPELNFTIRRNRVPADRLGMCTDILRKLPEIFKLPPSEFYRPSGRDTKSGIVFVPTVNDLSKVYEIVKNETRTEVVTYSGSPPKGENASNWDKKKMQNAKDFKNNRAPIMVATKAFGMGIDKPNIRWIIHFGMPGSLEQFYQESGRAGRDKEIAHCRAIFSEIDSDRSASLFDRNSSLEELRELNDRTSKNYEERDDVTTSLWFHWQNFSGKEREIDEVKNVLDEIGDLSSPPITGVRLASGEDGGNSIEKAICRLIKIGVIKDYVSDYGGGNFTVNVQAFDLKKYQKNLLDYIEAIKPSKREDLEHELKRLFNHDHTMDPRNSVIELATLLIEFVYTEIERSRRRAIVESMAVARIAQNNEDIWKRILAYLEEGFGAERVEELSKQKQISLSDWYEQIEKCDTAIMANELRGVCSRYLESHPDHPGLLLTRATAEAMCSDHDDSISAQDIGAAVRFGMGNDYRLSQESMDSVLKQLFRFALEKRANNLGVSLVIALLDLDESNEDFSFAISLGLRESKNFDDDRVVEAVSIYRFGKIAGNLGDAVTHLKHYYDIPSILKTIGGGE